MVLRMHNLSKWKLLANGKMLELRGTHMRKIRWEVNCSKETVFRIVFGSKPDAKLKGYMLGVACGLEVFEFTTSGQAWVYAEGEGEVWYFTNDGDDITHKSFEQVSFTKPMSRRTRNPELEHMMMVAERRAMMRESQMQANFDARLVEAKSAGLEPPHDPATGEILDGPSDGPDTGSESLSVGEEDASGAGGGENEET